jgi:tight adherence protein B
MPLILAFVVLLALSFLILMVASRPGKHEKRIQARLRQLGLGGHKEEEKLVEELLKPTANDRFVRIEAVLARLGIYEPLLKLIEQSDAKTTPSKVVLVSFGLAIGGFVAASLFFSLPLLRMAAMFVAALSPVFLLRFKRAQKIKAFDAALPDAMDLMARALRAGHSVGSAIEVVAEQGTQPIASEFGLVYQQQNFGLPFRNALMNMAARNPSKDLQFVITAMLVQKETGGNLAEILDRTTHVIRERLRIQGEIRIKSAQGRLTGWILSMLPIVMGFLINMVNPGFERPLFEQPIGRMMLYTGAGMLAIGAFFIRKIVSIEV